MGSAAELPDGGVRPGTVILERYRVDRAIGTGGMGTIWEGTHLLLQRPIAIKFIEIIGPQSSTLRDRFLREARVAAAVRHRNVVDIIDFGTAEDGRPFMVMELLRGDSLAEHLGSGPLPLPEAVRIVARLLSGLAAVHDAGIVHRDLKPENIFLVRDADGMFPKLIDFGVSRALDSASELESVLPTRENAIVGTPQYMSPEQARGLKAIDHRSDLWSAGVILYELLTGTLPYDAEAIGDVIIQIATEEPPDFATLRPDLGGPVAAVIKRAMSRSPADRFPDAREMRTALLGAVTKTATRLGAHESPPSDRPGMGATELLAAVGEAYEPGDSGVLEFTDHDLALPEFDAPDSGLRDIPAPARRGVDPFVARDALTLDAGQAPRSSLGVVIAGVSAGLALLGVAAAALGWVFLRTEPESPREAPEPPGLSATDAPIVAAEEPPAEAASVDASSVTVTLEGVPEGAEVRIDNELREGSVHQLLADAEPHDIEVRLGDGRTWSMQHRADEDATYEVELEGAAAVAPRRRRRARTPIRMTAPTATRSRSAARRGARSEGTLMRDPGF